jgi:hypothetical protein
MIVNIIDPQLSVSAKNNIMKEEIALSNLNGRETFSQQIPHIDFKKVYKRKFAMGKS